MCKEGTRLQQLWGVRRPTEDYRPVCCVRKLSHWELPIGECPPEIIDELRFAGGAYVVEDRFHASIGCDFFVSPELYGGHRKPFRSDASMSRASLFTRGKRTCARRSIAQNQVTALNETRGAKVG